MGLFRKEKSGIVVTNMNNQMYGYQSAIEKIYNKKNAKMLKSRNFLSNEVVYYLEFKGDVLASNVKNLRKEITTILLNAREGDEVLVSIESPGGTVTGYGLVAEQLDRLKKKGLKLTAVVDEVAASGGYMIASVADEIVVAKRAVIGSIGVVVGMPNYEEILSKIGVEYKFYTAGEKKRGVTPFTKPSEDQIADLTEQLASIHKQFKSHISEYRPDLEIEKVATGETWSGIEAVEMGLADRIGISDDEVMNLIQKNKLVLKVQNIIPKEKKSFLSRQMAEITSEIINTVSMKISNNIQSSITKKW